MRFNRGQLVSLVAVALTQLGQSTGAESVLRGVSPEGALRYMLPSHLKLAEIDRLSA